MELAKIVLEYIQAILTAQVVIGIVVILFYRKFNVELKNLIDRIASVKFPGGEISTPQQAKSIIENNDPKNIPSVPSTDKTIATEGFSLTPEQAKQIKDLFDAERAKAYLWEYRYLNYYLVLKSQRVLDWLSALQSNTTISFYDSFWQPIIPESNERKAIIDALQQHHLIVLNGELIEVSPKGKEYIQWRGPLPKLPA